MRHVSTNNFIFFYACLISKTKKIILIRHFSENHVPNLKIMPTAAEIAISTIGWHLKNYLTAIRPDASKIPCHINAPVSALKNASRTADVHALTTSAQDAARSP